MLRQILGIVQRDRYPSGLLLFYLRTKFGPKIDPDVRALGPLPFLMSEIGTEEHSLKAKYRLKIRLGAHLFQFVDLRTPAAPGADYLFQVSNSHVKIDPKFVTDNLEGVVAANFATEVEDGNERIAAREAVIDLGGGDLAHFMVTVSESFLPLWRERVRDLLRCLTFIKYQRFQRRLVSKSSIPESVTPIAVELYTSVEDEPKRRTN